VQPMRKPGERHKGGPLRAARVREAIDRQDGCEAESPLGRSRLPPPHPGSVMVGYWESQQARHNAQ
jgi:hypothetical protein